MEATCSNREGSLLKVYLSSLPALFLLLTLGCVTPVTPEQIASADYGTVPDPPTYQKAIKQLIQPMLFEPFTARFRFIGEPQKGYAYLSGSRQPPVFGYLVQVGINSKNMMGNYVGEEPFRFFIKNDTLYLLNKSDKAEVVP
jgi:hypothetical protein